MYYSMFEILIDTRVANKHSHSITPSHVWYRSAKSACVPPMQPHTNGGTTDVPRPGALLPRNSSSCVREMFGAP